MPLLLGLLAALGVTFAISKPAGAAGSDRVIVLVRALVPSGVATVGSVVSLLAQVQDAFAPGGFAPPVAFKARVVGVPDAGRPAYTAVFLSDVLGAKAGEFLEFAADKIQNVSG